MEEDNTPLSVTVTPCDAPLEWKLTLQELPEEASGEGSGEGGGLGGGVNDRFLPTHASVSRWLLMTSQPSCLVWTHL